MLSVVNAVVVIQVEQKIKEHTYRETDKQTVVKHAHTHRLTR